MFIYFDNAATSFPKPVPVIRAVENAVSGFYGNPGRSGHLLSRTSENAVFSARVAISEFVSSHRPENVVFTHNATYALNIAILGLYEALRKKKELPLFLTSVFEHNSVLRPLYRLEREGKIRLRIISPDKTRGNTASVSSEIKKGVDAVVLSSVSNTAGDAFDLHTVGMRAKKAGAFFLVDASQSLGNIPFNMENALADAVCAPCHKGLLGIMGLGFIAFSENPKELPEAVISGGVGNDPQNRAMPFSLPDRLEAGTLAVPAICAVKSGIEYLNKVGIGEICANEARIKSHIVSELLNIRGVTVYAPENENGPILFNLENTDPDLVSRTLDGAGIAVRSGFHCAPLSHAYYKTGTKGALRISPGPFNTLEEADRTVAVIYGLTKK